VAAMQTTEVTGAVEILKKRKEVYAGSNVCEVVICKRM